MIKAERLKRFDDVDIYPVTCEKLSAGRNDVDVLNGVIEGGAKIIQLREKELTKRELFSLALKFREITKNAGILFIVNDHVDIALAADADGVHLGQDDLPLTAARKIAPELIIGVSTHNEEEAAAAQKNGADYVNIGPVFPTGTKEGVDEFIGTKSISSISANLSIPFSVMGGINIDNVDSVIKEGAKKVAVVSAITKAKNIAAVTRSFIRKIRNSL